MKAIFLCEKSDKIFRVFDEEIRARLKALTGIEERVYTKAELLQDPASFSEVETVFSTWNMPVMTEEEIAQVIEVWTGIPAANISENEFARIDGLEKRLKERIIGQDKAVEAAAERLLSLVGDNAPLREAAEALIAAAEFSN